MRTFSKPRPRSSRAENGSGMPRLKPAYTPAMLAKTKAFPPIRKEDSMIIGVPKEIKDNEYRVALTPGGASLLVADGHRVLVEAGEGVGSGLSDDEYRSAGAGMLPPHADVYRRAGP